jgi:hypothetical protein
MPGDLGADLSQQWADLGESVQGLVGPPDMAPRGLIATGAVYV